jgi:hypothetical protein
MLSIFEAGNKSAEKGWIDGYVGRKGVIEMIELYAVHENSVCYDDN